MLKFFTFVIAALALPSIVKLKAGDKELSLHSSAIQDLHYFQAYADFMKHQKGNSITEFEIYDECLEVMPYLVALLTEFKHVKKLQSQFTDYTRLTFCASFYAAPNDFINALEAAVSEKQSKEDPYIRLYVHKYHRFLWKTTVGPLDISAGSWKEAEIMALNNGWTKDVYDDSYLIFKKLRE